MKEIIQFFNLNIKILFQIKSFSVFLGRPKCYFETFHVAHSKSNLFPRTTYSNRLQDKFSKIACHVKKIRKESNNLSFYSAIVLMTGIT